MLQSWVQLSGERQRKAMHLQCPRSVPGYDGGQETPEPRRQDAPPRPHRFDFQVFRLVGSNFQLIDAIDHEESACIPWRTSSPASWLPPFITSPSCPIYRPCGAICSALRPLCMPNQLGEAYIQSAGWNRTSIPTSTQQDLVLSPRASLFTTSGYAAAAMYCAEVRDALEPFSNNHPGPMYGMQVPSMSWVVHTGLDTFGRLKMPQGSKKWSS
ncbi:hypothetical protein CSPX01_01478 [Colletotrichum filicis]|nr:hypothetical protein CSPX01_01478 [Colletotrichum filicis]